VIPVILPGGTSARADDFLELRTWIDFKLGMDDQIAFHRLCAGIRGECPGRPELPHLEPRLEKVSERLKQIRSLRKVELIDDSVAVEYQRRLLDHLVE
jgi:hypothetical protein